MVRSRLKYYRACLADSERMDISYKKINNNVIYVKDLDSIPDVKTQKFFYKVNTDYKKQSAQREDNNVDFNHLEYINIFIAPLRLISPYLDNQQPRKLQIYPYWIPATLSRKGHLTPPENEYLLPWLVRGVLEPNDYLNQEYPTFCTLEHSDKCATDTEPPPTDSWEDYWQYSMNYFKKLCGGDLYSVKFKDWTTDTTLSAIIPANLKGSAQNLIRLYDQIISRSEDNLPQTLRALVNPKAPEIKHVGDIHRLMTQKGHYGQMGTKFPLSPSQRISLLILEKNSVGEILAVNGPPGTGKTTLLQSVCANSVVKAVLKKKGPPILLACSTNNQAITNILDSFSSVSPSQADRTGLNERWLPNLDSLGLYMAAKGRMEEAKKRGYFVATASVKKSDAYLEYIERHQSNICKDYFLGKFCATQGACNVGNLQTVIKVLFEKLNACKNQIDVVLTNCRTLLDICKERNISSDNLQQIQPAFEKVLDPNLKDLDFLVKIIKTENLSPKKPSLLKRFFDYLKFGPTALRRTKVIKHIGNKIDLIPKATRLSFYSLSAAICQKKDTLEDICEKGKQQLSEIDVLIETITKELEKWSRFLLNHSNLSETLNSDVKQPHWVERINMHLDLTLRHKAFWYALHIVEGMWLNDRNDKAFKKLNKGEDACRRRLKIQAHLTPFFISTFHSCPAFFCYLKKTPQDPWISLPLEQIVDLLIVDEAGQVSPEVGIAPFCLAKKALVVGDTKQIEPIWSISSKAIDYSNILRSDVCKSRKEYDELDNRLGCRHGSLMYLAQKSSRYQQPEKYETRGSLLREHRRCVSEIINYCNRFVYQDLLDIKTNSIEKVHQERLLKNGLPDMMRKLPALGYCHINTESINHHGSYENVWEAKAIAMWLAENQKALKKMYPNYNNLGQIVAIVTSFRLQKTCLQEALKKRNISLDGFTIGTIHALQGSEKPIVIFSSVYGRNVKSGKLFFDQSYNMLNVAVSRAKHHFLVFGCMRHFTPKSYQSPAGDLGHLLFDKSENELSSSFFFAENSLSPFKGEGIHRLNTLKMHRKALKRAFERAKKRLIIVSPFISIKALKADHISNEIKRARQRDVDILVFTDKFLNRENNILRQSAKEGMDLIKGSGAKLKIKEGIHNKALIVDREVLVEGSFNWLSAVRNPNSSYARLETSIVVKKPHAPKMIREAYEDLGIQ